MPGGSESSGWCSGGEGSLEEPDDAFTAVLDSLAAENHQLKRQLADACERVAKTNKVMIFKFISYDVCKKLRGICENEIKTYFYPVAFIVSLKCCGSEIYWLRNKCMKYS